MAKDMVRVFLKNIHNDVLIQKLPSSWCCKKLHRQNTTSSQVKEKRYKKRQEKYLFGTMTTDSGCIHAEYMRYSKTMGDILLTFSLPDLYFGNNSHLWYDFDSNEFSRKTLNELRFVLDVQKLPPLKEWGLSRDELTMDIIDTEENNKHRFKTMTKHKMLSRKKADSTYVNQGSMYFHSGDNRINAGRQLIVYDKSLQQANKGNDLEQILNLPPNHSMLRIEEKTKGSPLKTNINKASSKYEFPQGFTNLEIAFSKEYQLLHIKEILSYLGLDKMITTKDNLNSIIKNLTTLSPKRKKTCKRVVRYLNGEIKNISLDEKTIKFYKKIILETGYHFLFSDIDIPPVSLDEETGRIIVLKNQTNNSSEI